MSFFSDFSDFINSTKWRGWSLNSPNKYTFTGRNVFFKNADHSVYTVSFDTNMSSKFTVGFTIRF